MGKFINWLSKSNRWKHLLGGFILGLLSCGWYCAALVSGAVGAAMEFKDKQWGGKPDWIDAAMTLTGGLAGYGVISLLHSLWT